MTYEWKRCDVWSVVKIAFLMCGITGFFFGLLYAIFLVIIGSILGMIGGGELEEISGLFSGTFGFFMAFVLSFTYAVVGSIMAAILTWLYNFFARLMGGIRITLEPDETGLIADQRERERPPLPSPPSQSSSL
ncbi:MAG: DUF3566 domain-containing protein [Gemmatimonadota bacterium]|nr:MAG: DUF3566 domain-containing protein [Gemmatimonadota bacterium]